MLPDDSWNVGDPWLRRLTGLLTPPALLSANLRLLKPRAGTGLDERP